MHFDSLRKIFSLSLTVLSALFLFCQHSPAADRPNIFDDTRTTPPSNQSKTGRPAATQATIRSVPPNKPVATQPVATQSSTIPPAIVPPEPITTASNRAPLPDTASLKAADRLLKDTVGKEVKNAPVEVRRQQAIHLLAQSDATSDAAEKFVMLRFARQTAETIGDAPIAFKAARRILEQFDVDAHAFLRETITSLSKTAREPFDVETILSESILLVQDAIAVNDYATANSLSSEVKPLAERLKGSDVSADLTALSKRSHELASEYPTILPALTKLRSMPEDTAANTVVGRFLCLRKLDWKNGLPLLTHATELKLRDLAAEESAATPSINSSAVALKIADGWWDYAASQRDSIKLAVQLHAADWYRAAAGTTTGMRKLQIENRLAVADRGRDQIGVRPPGRWRVLFRGDEPSRWNHPALTPRNRSGFAADVESTAPADTAFLRLRRMDTGEAVIIALKKEDLFKQTATWCGSAWVGYGGTHLGIKNPKLKKLENGLVDIDANYQGWGFGHIMYALEEAARGYSWGGIKIEKTVFEIAVSADELNPAEKTVFVDMK